MLFKDRTDAGHRLARELLSRGYQPDTLVLGLPRGGVPVAFEVAKSLGAPLDVFVVRKLGVPGGQELAMGAIASGGVRVLNRHIVDMLGLSEATIDLVARREARELERREKLYRGNQQAPNIEGRPVILVDDGLATGSTMFATVKAVRQFNPSFLAVAVPVASPSTCAKFRPHTDEVICLEQPDPFLAVGTWYGDFAQTTDRQVRDFLEKARYFINDGNDRHRFY